VDDHELDIVRCEQHGDDRDLGIIYFEDGAFYVYFPYLDESEYLFEIGVEFVTNYFYVLDDPKYKDFISMLPYSIRPDADYE